MQKTNIALRISLGFALLAFLLPFAWGSIYPFGSKSFSGLAFAFGGKDMFGGQSQPIPSILWSFLLLVITFLLSLCKRPLGRWIGVIPLVPVLIFSDLASNSGGDGYIQLRWGLGLYASLLASLAASILGFMGRSAPEHQQMLVQDQLVNAPKDSPLNVKDQAGVKKVLRGYKLIIVAIVLLLIVVVFELFGANKLVPTVTLMTGLAAIGIGIFAFLRVAAVLHYEIPIRVVVSILILLPLINIITLIVLAIKIGIHLQSIGIQISLLGAKKADISQ